MNKAIDFTHVFGDRQGRSAYADQLLIRDANFIADLKERISKHATWDNQTSNNNWSVEFSPTQTDDLTERSLFHAILTSIKKGERRLSFVVARDWVEIGGGAMESSVRSNVINLEMALDNAFRRVVLRSSDSSADLNLSRSRI